MAEGRAKKRELARFAGETEKTRQETIELFSFFSFFFFHGVTADSAYNDVVETGLSERISEGKEGEKKKENKDSVQQNKKKNKNTSQWRTSGGEWWVRKAGENAMRLI